jgi:hypothetical protein
MLIEISGGDPDDEDNNTYEIVITWSEDKNKALNTNRNFQWLSVSTDLKKFTTKDKKTSEYFPSQIGSNVNRVLFDNMINKEKVHERDC